MKNDQQVYDDLWRQMTALEPGLVALMDDARELRDRAGRDYCQLVAYTSGYGGHPSFKRRLNTLVGMFARVKDPLLGSSDAWNVGVDHLLEALPPCSPTCVCADVDS